MSWRSLIVAAVANAPEFFSPVFLRELERSSPFRFAFLQARHKKLSSRRGLYVAVFNALIARPGNTLSHHKKSPHPFAFHRKLSSSGGRTVEDWKFTQQDASEALARLHFFSIKKKHAHGEVEARITVKEFATAKTTDMKFFAVADIELNQKA